MNLKSLFSSPIATVNYPNYQEHKSKLLQSHAHNFSGQIDTENKCQSDFHSWMTNRVNEYMDKISSPIKIKFQRYWINNNKYGENMPVHGHRNVVLISCFYLQATKDSGNIVFVDSRGSGALSLFPGNFDCNGKNIDGGMFHSEPVEEGKLIIFPGYLLHYVETNMNSTNRLSISSNFIRA